MLSDRFYDLASIEALQRAVRDVTPGQVLLTVAALLGTALVVDYAWMLWLRSKMVSNPPLHHCNCNNLTDTDRSHPGRGHGP